MTEHSKDSIEEQLQNLVEKFQGETSALKKILLGLTPNVSIDQPTTAQHSSKTKEQNKDKNNQ